jgi:hypothetical protein
MKNCTPIKIPNLAHSSGDVGFEQGSMLELNAFLIYS